MTNPFAPLSEDEFDQLDQFLLYDVDTEESMTLDMVDGFLHALAVGPTTVHPKQWLPKIWGTKEMMPPMNSIEELNHTWGWSCVTSTASFPGWRRSHEWSVLAGQP
ncbi:YecA family protein [Variovorax sp. LjRoot175]|uniref:YecA/YgfB family protein n=1 Tax=Variovorax sp. LjRoot175 TaxID=3342276 RepID=UPI003ECEDD46